MDLPKLTTTEQEALIESMQHSFGACTCRQVNGHTMYCDGHRFISEVETFGVDQQLIDRVTRLVMYRRMAALWSNAEFARPFQIEPGPMLEPDPLPPDLIPTSLLDQIDSPTSGDDTDRLPW